jgi:hypothetical protein
MTFFKLGVEKHRVQSLLVAVLVVGNKPAILDWMFHYGWHCARELSVTGFPQCQAWGRSRKVQGFYSPEHASCLTWGECEWCSCFVLERAVYWQRLQNLLFPTWLSLASQVGTVASS